ncbi:MAG: transposase [Candidatus Sphingomonas phytovorans]|nr:transposase [Sphingomonas sp.]WEK02632.1 MAG: transposase [Sphingomonas sp.]
MREVACWAHFRRKIFEHQTTSPTPLTNKLLDRIATLFRIEEEKLSLRSRDSLVISEGYCRPPLSTSCGSAFTKGQSTPGQLSPLQMAGLSSCTRTYSSKGERGSVTLRISQQHRR